MRKIIEKNHCSFCDTTYKLTNMYLIQCPNQVIMPSSTSPHCSPSIPPFQIFSGFRIRCVHGVLHGDCHCGQSRSSRASVCRSLSGWCLSGASHRALPWELKSVALRVPRWLRIGSPRRCFRGVLRGCLGRFLNCGTVEYRECLSTNYIYMYEYHVDQ